MGAIEEYVLDGHDILALGSGSGEECGKYVAEWISSEVGVTPELCILTELPLGIMYGHMVDSEFNIRKVLKNKLRRLECTSTDVPDTREHLW